MGEAGRFNRENVDERTLVSACGAVPCLGIEESRRHLLAK
jgi:hypothetical protein